MLDDGFAGFYGETLGACGGFIEQWTGRAVVWMVLSDIITSKTMLPLHRCVLQAINSYQPSVFRRLEMTVESSFEPGHKWAKMLGFTLETPMPCYGPDAASHHLYSRIRG